MSKNFFVGMVFSLTTTISFSQIPDTLSGNLKDVIISTNKVEQKQSETGKVVTVISSNIIQKNIGRTIAELLNQQTGIVINGANNNLGTNQSVYTRGTGLGNTLILIDGIPMYDPAGITNDFDLNQINLNMVEKIEIMKGAQSTLYGSDAVAGVINIITKKTISKNIEGYVIESFGSYNTNNIAAGISGKQNRIEYRLNVNNLTSKGFSSASDSSKKKNFDADKFNQNSINGNLIYKVNSQLSLNVFSIFNKYTAAVDAGAYSDDEDYENKNKSFQAGFNASYQLRKNRFKFNYQYHNNERTFIDDSISVGGFSKYQNGLYSGKSHFVELYSNLFINKNISLLAGTDFRINKTNQKYFSLSAWGPFTTSLGDTAKTNQASIYTSLHYKKENSIQFEVGGRLNNHSIYGWNGTFTFNPYYFITKNTKVYFNASSAFRVPSLYQLFSEYGNKNLKPEKSETIELGVQTSFNNNANLRVSTFIRNVKDVIIFYTNPSTWDSKYMNADKQKDYGVEVETNFSITKYLTFNANYTYVKGELSTKSFATGKDTSINNLYRRPSSVLNASVNYQNKKFNVSTTLRSVAETIEPVYNGKPTTLKGFTVLNVYTDYTIGTQLRLFIDLRNIFNKEYFEISGYNSRKFNFTTGLKYNF